MYNLNSHYENIANLANSIIAGSRVVYLHPFGATQPENIELIDPGDGSQPMILAYDQEPIDAHYNSYLVQNVLDNFVDDWGFRKKSIILISTEKQSKEKDNLCKKFNLVDVNYFFHGACASDWYRGYKFNVGITNPGQRKLTKKFITFNRITGNSRIYRTILIAKLSAKGLLDDAYASFSPVCPVHGTHYQDSLRKDGHKFGISTGQVEHLIGALNQIKDPCRIDSVHSDHIPNQSFSIGPLPELMSSFLHVVTETMFWDERTHLTEKIFKPIVAKQPFVLVGCYKNLEYLKSYGFRTFDRWWGEDYDNIADPHQRLDAVVDVIEKICKLSLGDLEDMLVEMQEVLEYNYNWFYNPEFVNSIWNELKINLTAGLNDKRLIRTQKELYTNLAIANEKRLHRTA